ncbi:MAG: C-GCAxxG-C-C family protein [Dehalococcoidales bacterium]|jgi:hypothetical protein
MSVLDHAAGNPMEIEEHAAAPLAGGVVNYGYQCGMLWGAALAAGAQAYHLHGPGPKAETVSIVAAQRLVESFRAKYKYIDCLEISDLNLKGKIHTGKMLKFLVKGGPLRCFGMSPGCARMSLKEINAALADTNIEVPPPPVSCVSLLLQKMGASEMHTVMAAGFAGGIGLSGDGCGALGAAVWKLAMQSRKKGEGNKDINARIGDMINKFLKVSDFKFECAEIAGRRFENISDHAAYVRDGGCAKIIDFLAADYLK